MRIVEKISVNFTDNNHGILRAIPESYKGHPLHIHINSITSGTQAPTQYTSSSSNGNDVLQIGNPSTTVTGVQEYTIDYSVKNVISFYKDHDELYWDVNGDQWEQPFTSVNATLHLAPGLSLWSTQPQCYVGTYGSTSQNCIVNSDKNVSFGAANLGSQSTLTFVVGFKQGYFHPYTWKDYLSDYGADMLELFVPILLIGGAGFVWWFRRGRDAKGTGVIVPQYGPPDGLTPLEVGAIYDFVADSRDLTATIIDLAIRKYIQIIESDDKRLLVMKHKGYTLKLLNKDWSALNSWERELLGALFGVDGGTEMIDIAYMKTKLYSDAKNIKDDVSVSLTTRGYFVANPIKYLGLSLATVVLIALFVGPIFHGVQSLLLVGLIIGLILFGLFYHFLPARTAKGVAAKEQILGLKLYLEVAEKDRIAKLQSPDAPYAEKTDAPTHTVELFEKLLPYAIVLQVEQKWAGQFKDIYAQPPEWYVGNYAAFNAGYLVGSLNSGLTPALNNTFSSPSSSGGSGFGGGFAGGGGGGGGGGGW